MTTNEMKKSLAKTRRKFLAVHRKQMKQWMEEQAEKEIERDYRRWQHDQRMMWFRENDGSNQCIRAGGWAILLNRIAA